MTGTLRLGSLAALLVLAPAIHAQAWIPFTPEELSMTSIPEVPGATAMVLYKEQTTDDNLRSYSFYSRIKILTEGGKDMANVELPFGGKGGISLEAIAGRTIHPDGTVIPFTSKPYDKVVEKVEGYKLKERVFTLPDVTVGSIIEYRYKYHYDDNYFMSPDWFIQDDLFVRKAHYVWNATHRDNQYIEDSHGNMLDRIAWTPILPPGFKVVETDTIDHKTLLSLDITDIKPLPKEDFMPPINSFSYRVLFYYTGYKTPDEYWAKEGKIWSKERDKFIGPGKQVKEAVNTLIAPGDASGVKLHKIYDAVEAIENTDFTRERSTHEENAAGLKPPQSTDDILSRKRGSGDQLTDLFVAMARAAGFKAYIMAVADRNERLFYSQYLSFNQLDDEIAIVNLDGKDLPFDPGQRYCAYGQLSWKHAFTDGLRQTDGGNTILASTPGGSYKDSTTSRIADLTLDEHGVASGMVSISYSGSPALYWRQEALRGDATSLNNDFKENLEHLLPGGLDVSVTGIENITNPGQPLVVKYEIKGLVGSSTGKRLLVPANLFASSSKPRFPQAKRELAIDMHYPSTSQDAVRFKLPAGIEIESAPNNENDKLALKQDGKPTDVASFQANSTRSANTITLYRNVLIGRTFFTADEYPDVRSFYGKIDAKDQETLVLTHASETPKSGGNTN